MLATETMEAFELETCTLSNKNISCLNLSEKGTNQLFACNIQVAKKPTKKDKVPKKGGMVKGKFTYKKSFGTISQVPRTVILDFSSSCSSSFRMLWKHNSSVYALPIRAQFWGLWRGVLCHDSKSFLGRCHDGACRTSPIRSITGRNIVASAMWWANPTAGLWFHAWASI